MEQTKSLSNAEILKVISADRERTNVLRKYEQLTIAFLVKRIPEWISSDMLRYAHQYWLFWQHTYFS